MLDYLSEAPASVAGLRCVVLGAAGFLRHRAKALSGTFEPLANAWVRRGAAMVASAGALVTDRLHVHVFAILLGVPHVVLDNSYGKLRATFDTWTSESGLATWADDAEAALNAAAAISPHAER